MAQITNMMAGTIMDTRHATFGSKPEPTIGLKSTLIMKICVTPPPRLPHPAAVAFAVPTTFGANMSEHQNWLVTKVAPAQPMKNLVWWDKTQAKLHKLRQMHKAETIEGAFQSAASSLIRV